MSTDFLIDNITGDLVIEDGDFQMTSSKPQFLQQRMTITFRTFTGEWFWNTTFGAISRDIVLRAGASQAEIDGWFLAIINGFPEVNSVLSFMSLQNSQSGLYDLTFTVATDEGNVAVYIRSGRPDVEITYPTPAEFPIDLTDCGVSIEDADRFYKLINIDIPVDIPWV